MENNPTGIPLTAEERAELGMLSDAERQSGSEELKKRYEQNGKLPTLDEIIKYDITVGTNVPTEYLGLIAEQSKKYGEMVTLDGAVEIYQAFVRQIYEASVRNNAGIEDAIGELVAGYVKYKRNNP